jgi:hypothetical protein
MALQPGQKVRVKNATHVIGKIVRLRDSDPVDGDIYEVEIDPRHLYLRAASLEVLEEPRTEMKHPRMGTNEWVAEAQRAPRMLQAVIDNPYDPVARKALVEALDKLGLIMPINPESDG